MIHSSLDWNIARYDLVQTIIKTTDRVGAMRMIWNIDDMVTDLSRLEVDARRTRVTHYTVDQLEKVNQAILTFEQLLMITILTS